MKEKSLSLLLALFFSAGLHAEIVTGFCGAEGENISYTLDTETGVLALSGSGHMADYNNSPWSDWDLQQITVGEGITHLGNSAFRSLVGGGGGRNRPFRHPPLHARLNR